MLHGMVIMRLVDRMCPERRVYIHICQNHQPPVLYLRTLIKPGTHHKWHTQHFKILIQYFRYPSIIHQNITHIFLRCLKLHVHRFKLRSQFLQYQLMWRKRNVIILRNVSMGFHQSHPDKFRNSQLNQVQKTKLT